MGNRMGYMVLLLTGSIFFLGSCSTVGMHERHEKMMAHHKEMKMHHQDGKMMMKMDGKACPDSCAMMSKVSKAVAVLAPTAGNAATGIVTFTKTDSGVHVVAELKNLAPGKHGFHIHELGDISAPDGTSAGGHFNPAGMSHGGPMAGERHGGDMGNVVADDNGSARLDYVDSHIKLNGPESIIGRGVILHADEDDLKSQPTGAAGSRIASGVIGIANPN